MDFLHELERERTNGMIRRADEGKVRLQRDTTVQMNIVCGRG